MSIVETSSVLVEPELRTLLCIVRAAGAALVSCAQCGARAHDPASVCEPVEITEAGCKGN